MGENWTDFVLTHGEFLVDQHGRVRVLRGAPPHEDLAGYARAFLLLNRQEIEFLYRRDPWLSVRIERSTTRTRDAEHASVTVGPVTLPDGITKREVEILTLLAAGLRNADIAERLGTSPRTVTTQVDRVMKKFDQHSRASLAALAVDAQLIALPAPGGSEGLNAVAAITLERMAHALKTGARTFTMEAMPRRLPRRPVFLGTLAALSGYSGEDALEHMRGTALAIEEINAGGGVLGRRVEHVVAAADVADPASVRQAMDQLTTSGVDAITGSHISAEHPFLFDMAAAYGRPLLHLDTFETHAALVRDNPARYGMIYQTCPSEIYYAKAFSRLLNELDRGGSAPVGRRLAVVEMDVPSARIASPEFAASLADIGWTISFRQTVSATGVDWNDTVRKALDEHVDIVMVTHFVPAEAIELQRELAMAGFGGLTYYAYTASHPTFTQKLGPLAEGVLWSSTTTLSRSESATAFRRNYQRRFSTPPGLSQASAAYDQARLLAWGWMQNGSLDPEGTVRALREGLYRGLNGTYFFGNGDQTPLSYPDGTNDPTLGLPLITYQIQGGVPVPISPALYGTIDDLRRTDAPSWRSI